MPYLGLALSGEGGNRPLRCDKCGWEADAELSLILVSAGRLGDDSVNRVAVNSTTSAQSKPRAGAKGADTVANAVRALGEWIVDMDRAGEKASEGVRPCYDARL